MVLLCLTRLQESDLVVEHSVPHRNLIPGLASLSMNSMLRNKSARRSPSSSALEHSPPWPSHSSLPFSFLALLFANSAQVVSG